MVTSLEKKLFWWFNNIDDHLSKEDLELLLMSDFDCFGQLKLNEKITTKELYLKFWRRFQ